MSASLRTIRVLSDGRPGHENQSAGLAAALARRTGAVIQTVRLSESPLKWASRFPTAARVGEQDASPDLLIGTGHRVHLPLAYAARRFRARSIVIMRPTWPLRLFDLCLIPSHDCPARCAGQNVIQTRGALNRIPELIPSKQARGMVLIGGPSKHHAWDAAPLAAAVKAVVASRPDLKWTIGNSFRTPKNFLEQLAHEKVNADLVSHSQTTPEWLPGQLLAADEVWVTEDSVSMLHEAVTAGARTGLLPMPARSRDARPTRAVQGLVEASYATTYESWKRNGQPLPPAKRLNETARCAEIILQRFFPRHSGA